MGTPVEQYIPAEFQAELDLPGPVGADPRQVELNRQLLGQAQRSVQGLTARAEDLRKRIRAAKPRTKAGASAAPGLQAELTRVERSLAEARRGQATAQNRVWELTGEYDKLLSGADRDAFAALKAMFAQVGLDSLAPKIYEYVKQGYGADTIGLLLQDTREYKERFAANEVRRKAGLAVLSPQEYLAAEAAYRQVLSSAGMPKGFYDNAADFRQWIGGDVSAAEVKGRVDLAMDAVNRTDPAYRDTLWQMYGVGERDLAAYFLDRRKAEPILKKQAAAGAIGAAALRRGFGVNTLDLEGYAELGVSGQEAEQVYAQIAQGFDAMVGIAGRDGSAWSQREAEQEIFMPGATGGGAQESAASKGRRLRSQERAQFSGARGASSQGLSAGYRQT